MKAYFNIENPDAADLTLRLTLTTKEWREIAADLPDDHRSTGGAFARVIKSMAEAALKQVDAYYVTTGWDTRTVDGEETAIAKSGAA